MKKNLFAVLLVLAAAFAIQTGCKKETPGTDDEISTPQTNDELERWGHKKYSADVANAWMKMEIKVMSTTGGIPHVAYIRPYAYSAVALYESVVKINPSMRSLVGQLNGLPAMPQTNHCQKYHWACSANAAMASILKSMFPATSVANVASIDSLELVFNTLYATEADTATINRSIAYGKAVAQTVFNWSETDGYLNANNPYTPPVGPGLWVPTAPTFAPASAPYWGNLRVMVVGSGNNAQPAAPLAYSEIVGSPFYLMVKQVYDASQTLTQAQMDMALYWRDLPGVTSSGHYLSITDQVLESSNAGLEKAVVAYALGGIVAYDAAISTWQTKYNYNLVRPITYIRNVLGDTTWNSYLTTPAHPECSSAHGSISAAFAAAMEKVFKPNYSFTDHTYDYLGMPARTFASFKACGEDAGNSRLYAGIHYQPSIDAGLIQGRKIADNIIHTLHFRGH